LPGGSYFFEELDDAFAVLEEEESPESFFSLFVSLLLSAFLSDLLLSLPSFWSGLPSFSGWRRQQLLEHSPAVIVFG